MSIAPIYSCFFFSPTKKERMPWRKYSATKYGATKVEANGLTFSSKLEESVYQIILLREKAGEIKLSQCQHKIYLTEARIGYVADFYCEDLPSGIPFWIEAKGFITERWGIVKKLYKFYGPGKLEIWGGNYRNPQLIETITPKVTEGEYDEL